MASYSQYSTGTVPTQIVSYFSGQIRLLDEYYLIRTGENQCVGNIVKPNGTEYTYIFNTSTSGYSSYYDVTILEESSSINISRPVYAYSSVGTLGVRLDTPIVDNMASFSLCFVACVLALYIMFKGVLFRCFGRKRK